MKKFNIIIALLISFSVMPKITYADTVMPSYTIMAVSTNQQFESNTPNKKSDLGELIYGMLGLVVNDKFKRNEQIEIPKIERPSGVSSNMIAGEKFTVDDILRVMFVGSSDEGALILANLLGGQGEAVKLMNEKAKQLGLKDTSFGTVLSKKDAITYSSPADMAILYKQIFNTPRIYDMMMEKTFLLPETTKAKQRTYRTNNYLIDNYLFTSYYNSNAIAGRTGYVSGGACNMVAFAKIDGVRVIIVSMGSQKTSALLPNLEFAKNKIKSMTKDYQKESIFKAGEILTDYAVKSGKGTSKVLAVSPNGINILIPKGSAFTYDKKIVPLKESFTAPIAKGQKLANMIVSSNGKKVLTMDLVAESEVKVSLIGKFMSSIVFKLIIILLVLWLYWKICIQIPKRKRRKEILKRRKESQEWLEANKGLY